MIDKLDVFKIVLVFFTMFLGYIVLLKLKIIGSVKRIEGFEGEITQTPSTQDSIQNQESEVINQCNPGPWWKRSAPKQIIALDTGYSFPVIAKEESKGISSLFQVPHYEYGTNDLIGCFSVNQTDGSFKTTECNSDSMNQLWNIVSVPNKEEYIKLLENGRGVYSGLEGDSFYNGLDDIDYGFFMVVSAVDPSKVLASGGNQGRLTITTVGKFFNQRWEISNQEPSVYVAVHEENINSEKPKGGLNPIQSLNAQPDQPYLTAGKSAMEKVKKNGSLNINLNLNSGDLSKLLGVEPAPANSVDPNETIVSLNQNGKEEGFDPNCPSCPSIVTDYIKNNQVPCLGCNLK